MTNKDLKPLLYNLFTVFFCIFLIIPANGGIVFSDLDLSPDNKLLFRAAYGYGGGSAQDVLYLSRLSSVLPAGNLPGNPAFSQGVNLQQLSAFPEKIDLLDNGRILQIRNAFGALRVPVSGGLPIPVPGLPSFAGGSPAAAVGRAEEMAPSADGRWLLYMDPVSPAFGNLVLLDVHTGAKTLIASRLERPGKIFPASWSPDSRYFLYERGNRLYYYMTGSSPMPADEKTRLIGEGTVNSVSFGLLGDFFYINGSTLYHVRGNELFARAIYADFLEIGIVAGKIPFEFDPLFDSFWTAPDRKSVLVSKGHRSLFYFHLNDPGKETSGVVLPLLMLPRLCSDIAVLWPAGGMATVLVSVPSFTDTEVKIWRLNIPEAGEAGFPMELTLPGGVYFEPLLPPGMGVYGSVSSGSLSPDGKIALLWGRGGILLYDYDEWKFLGSLSIRPGLACLWTGNDELIIGDDQKIERISLKFSPGGVTAGRDTICLSRVSQAGFEEGSYRILAKCGESWFVTDGRNPWAVIEQPRLKSTSMASSQYRVFLERQRPGLFLNLPMIRNISSVGTYSLFPQAEGSGSGLPGRAYQAPREAALCFDLYDDDRGLPEILDALNRHGIKATFFLNGEFIRRHPEAVVDLAQAGHEIASMFYALIDLSDARYRTGNDFIARGLARNEDEFFRVTGKELTLLWHPPWYVASPDIAAAASGAGYTTLSRDVDPMDWVSREDEKRLGLPQKSPSEMIDHIMETVKPGSVIPVRLGLLSGGRNDYLFNRINVLIDALIREGYTLTTVSDLPPPPGYRRDIAGNRASF